MEAIVWSKIIADLLTQSESSEELQIGGEQSC